MLRDRNDIDDLFNDFLHDHEEEVPTFVWTNLRDELKAEKRLRILYFLKAIAASVALFITFTLGYYVSDLHIIGNNSFNFKEDSLKLFSFTTNETTKNTGGTKIEDLPYESKKRIGEQKTKTNTGMDFQMAKYKRIKIYETNQLYRKYQFIKKLFISSKNTERSIILSSSDGRRPNQLLTDTLLLEKENLHEGGFLLTEKKDKISAWSFGTKFSPVVSVGDNNKGNTTSRDESIKTAIKPDKPELNSEEKPLTSYTGGINVNYQVSKRLSVESGLFYSQRKQGTDNLVGSQDNGFGGDALTVYTPNGTQLINSMGNRSIIQNSFSTTYYMLNASFISNAEYIELPLIIRYKLIDQKIGLDVLSGVSSNFLVNNSSYILSGDKTLWSGNNKDINSILYGATLGLGVNYNFYQNFSFNLEPTFKYTILSDNSVFGKYPYSFAVFAGFSYRFK